jgi:transketolase
MPMGMADIAEVLWNDHLKHNPANPGWWDRDRFVLSNGHGSMLLYSLLHLSGYELPIEELKNFRQYHSTTPGHPEYGETPGVETTTGPLGQGVANAVGMALAEQLLARRFNREGHDIVDHRTWVFLGDGCLMEGISHEACSLAGRLGLGKLMAFWDDNGISIDGEVDGWFTDDTPARFEAYGWQVIRDVDGHDPVEIQQAIETALGQDKRPTLICCRTVIGYGSPGKQGTAATHGAPLGEEEVARAREELGWSFPPFEVPEDIRNAWNALESGRGAEKEWQERFDAYSAAEPELAAEFSRRMSGELPDEWKVASTAAISAMQEKGGDVATRKSSEIALEAFGPYLPELIGGSADLTGSNNTFWSGSVDVTEGNGAGNYVYYGVREFAMTAISTGLALHGGFIPYDATFLVFSDYARNAVRMSALIGIRAIHVYTHDSIGLGEDGPTHQPVEHVASLRLIPNLEVWRPCDTLESGVAWKHAIGRKGGPTALVFTRQKLSHQRRDEMQVEQVSRGGYVLRDAESGVDVILIATGSEVEIAMAAAQELEAENVGARVVSMPNPELFLRQDEEYRESVLPSGVSARVAVEAGVPQYWRSFVGDGGRVVGIDRFGASAPGNVMYERYGLTSDNVRKVALSTIN